MTPKTTALLLDPHPNCHIVYPYTDERLVAAAVSLFTAGGLSKNEVVVLIATPHNQEAIESCLEAEQFPVEQHKRDGLLRVLGAEELLSQILVNGTPDAERFEAIVGGVVSAAKLQSPSGKVRLFGEMVSLLWECDHNGAAAAQLEDLWNGLIDRHSVPLLCTYALHGRQDSDHRKLPDRLIACHSHCLAA